MPRPTDSIAKSCEVNLWTQCRLPTDKARLGALAGPKKLATSSFVLAQDGGTSKALPSICAASFILWLARQANQDEISLCDCAKGSFLAIQLTKELHFKELLHGLENFFAHPAGDEEPADVGENEGTGFCFGQDPKARKSECLLQVTVEKGLCTVSFHYSATLFEDLTANRMVARYLLLLQAALTDKENKVYALPLLTKDEELTLNGWNETDSAYPNDVCIHEIFEERAVEFSDKVAVEAADGCLTYKELNERANQLAHALIEGGLAVGDFVGISLKRCVNTAVSVLAILKAGGAHLYLDPAYPKERLVYMVEDSGAAKVITSKDNLPSFPHIKDKALILGEWLNDYPTSNPQADVTAEDLAYLVYTSGSTGKPKGAPIHHRAACNFITDYRRREEITADDRIFQFLSLSFDAWLKDIYMAFTTGSTLVFRQEGAMSSIQGYIDELAASKATVTVLPTAFWHLWMSEAAHLKEPVPSSLRMVAVCGAAVSPLALKRWKELHPEHVRFFNEYGPAECTIDVTLYEFCDDLADIENGVPIGPAIANTKLYVVDEYLQRVPIGVEGELLIGGHNVSRGYHRRELLNKERFIPSPFTDSSNSLLYRTGDVVRYRSDGKLVFCSRVDNQVKIRGNRVEPGEVERAMEALPYVEQAIVVAQSDDFGEKMLVAFWVKKDVTQECSSRLEDDLRATLPDYLIPSRYFCVEDLPKTPAGKVDRKKLSSGSFERQGAKAELPQEKRTPTEELLLEIWKDTLGIEEFSIDDDFYGLGGHSLMAVRLLSAVGRHFGFAPHLDILFTGPTVRQMAEKIDERDAEKRNEEEVEVEIGQKYPCTSAQERFWVLDKLYPADSTFNVPLALHWRGPFDVSLFEEALSLMTRKHAALRTTFSKTKPPRQVLRKAFHVTIQESDLSQLAENTDKEQLMKDFIARETKEPFDLFDGPLLRCSRLCLGSDANLLVFVFHHIIFDGWSAKPFMEELCRFYRLLKCGDQKIEVEEDLHCLVLEAKREETYKSQQEYAEKRSHWQKVLKDCKEHVTFPIDFARPSKVAHQGAAVSALVPNELKASLLKLARERKMSPFLLLQGALAFLLSRLSDESQLTIGTPVAMRKANLQKSIGCFLNTAPLLFEIDEELSFDEFLVSSWHNWQRTQLNLDVPFEECVALAKGARSPALNPLFQVFINMYSFAYPQLYFGEEVDATLLSTELIGAKYDFNIYVEPQDQSWTLRAIYSEKLYKESTAQTILSQLISVLQFMVAEPSSKMKHCSLVTKERTGLWKNNRLPKSEWHSLLQLVRQKGHQAEEKIALSDGYGTSLTYGELLKRVAVLAAHLQRQIGIASGEFVAISGKRRAELAVAILSVLDIGCVFTVVDENQPAARTIQGLERLKLSAWLTLDGQSPPSSFDQYISAKDIPIIDCADFKDGETDYEVITPQRDSPACVVITSGSTGRPQAVLGRHSSLTHFVHWMAERYELDETDRFSVLAGLAHDPLQRELFTALSLGARLVFPTEEQRLSVGLSSWLHDEEVTVLHLAPVSISLLEMGRKEVHEKIKCAFFTGEALTWAQAERFRRIYPKATIVNSYGTTETQRAVVQYVVPARTEGNKGAVPAGSPIPDVEIDLLRKDGTRAGIGEPGEIVFRSPYIALGYEGDEEKTTQRFSIRDELPSFSTGDIGRIGADGLLRLVGRKDRQIQVRGYRVELAEIETVAQQFLKVERARALPVPSLRTESEIGLVVTPDCGEEEKNGLINHFLQHLPEYMLPAKILQLDKLPQTVNGKIDDKKLTSLLAEANINTVSTDEKPKGATELPLWELWCEQLQRDEVSVHDSFFALGGTSLDAIELFERIRQKFGCTLPVSTLFEAQTIRALANRIEAGETSSTKYLVQISGDEKGQRLYLVHNMVGDVLDMRHICQQLPKRMSAFGIRSTMQKEGRLFADFKEMVDEYVGAIVEHYDGKPVIIAGHSLGGAIALAMAQALKTKGVAVKKVYLLDAYPPGFWTKMNKLPFHRKFLALLKGLPVWCYRFVSYNPRWYSLAWQQVKQTIAGGHWVDRFPLAQREIALHLEKIFEAAVLEKCELPTILVRAKEERVDVLHGPYDYCWSEHVTGEFSIVEVEGNHVTMLIEPFAKQVAHVLANDK